MTFKETKTEQNQTLANVPLDMWAEFKVECAKERVTMTEGFIQSFKLWKEYNELSKED